MNSFTNFTSSALGAAAMRALIFVACLGASAALCLGQQEQHHSHDLQEMSGMKMETPRVEPVEKKQNANEPPRALASPAISAQNGEMDHAKMSLSNSDALLVMDGESMGIRVGRAKDNYMSLGREGSGTSWLPTSSPMNMWHKTIGQWLLMLHGNIILGVNSQGGPRGSTKLESQNWIMPMAVRRVGQGTLQLRGMLSLEPFTYPPGGSPLLFQTGESYKGRPLIDAQHPHDLLMELSATYTVPLGERGTWFGYLGYPGEPALGPVAFMHRLSASENPAAPLGHHLEDSTHISFGVLTSGFTYRWFKLEGSIFNGREPDENRYNLESNPWSSRSARLSFAPNRNWSFQLSHGFLRNPEALEPGDIRRTTASASYNKSFNRGNWATTFIWGRNHGSHHGELFNLNGYTAESTVNFRDKNYLYTRLELVDRNELLREEDFGKLNLDSHLHPSFRIGAYTFGYSREVWNTDKISMAIGSDFSFYSKPQILNALYGQHPTSYRCFIRFRPSKMKMNEHKGMSQQKADQMKDMDDHGTVHH